MSASRRRWPRAILLDLDGTLVDTVPDLARCVDAMLSESGRPPCGAARVRAWVGNGAERLIARALTGRMDGEPDAALLTRALARFLALYARHTCEYSRLYPGVAETLRTLRAGGARLACVTNKPVAHSESLLRHLGLRAAFDLVLGGDSLARHKPDPLPLTHALGRLEVTRDGAVMVGDSVNDVRAARAARVPIVCVSYGYNHGGDIRATGPDAVIDEFGRLPERLRRFSTESRMPTTAATHHAT